MGIGNAFTTALGGLTAYAAQIGYISDNLANTSTVGYKRVDASFQSYVTASTSSYHEPGGVTIQPVYRNSTAGQISTSSVGTNFAVSSGEGLIPVEMPASTTAGVANFSSSTQCYTRAGDFSVDSNGYLVNSAGYYLMGLKETTAFSSPAGSTIPGTASLGSLTAVRIDPTVYKSMPGTASSIIDFNGNFPASMTASTTVPDTSAQITSQVQFYDSLGTVQTMEITYQKTASGTWDVESATLPSDSNATVSFPGGTQVIFDSNGALSSITNASSTVSSGDLGIDFSISGLSDGATDSAAQTVSLDFGTTSTGTTQYSGTTLEMRNTTDTTGKAAGEFQSASVDSDGYVIFSYSNGQQAKPYRVPLVTFSDPDKLTRVSGSTFAANATESGSPVAQWAGEGDAGTISASSLEASNVDIADELTSMIVAQRAYSANGKVITTADEMIKETLSLKQ